MFSHVLVGALDVEASKRFYDATLGALGVQPGTAVSEDRCFWATETGMFAITKPINGEPATHANGGTIGFLANSPAQVDAWHAAGVASGGTSCEDPPGVRDLGSNGRLYLAYLRDPAGNKLCGVYRLSD